MSDDQEKELRAYVERWRLASAKFEELRRKDLRNVNVAEHIEAMNGAFKAALVNSDENHIRARGTTGDFRQNARCEDRFGEAE